MIFFHREGKFAQVGDVLFKGSIGRTDFPRGDYDTLIHSITQKLWPLGDDVPASFPATGRCRPPATNGAPTRLWPTTSLAGQRPAELPQALP